MQICPLCFNPVDPDSPDVWKEVKGWVGGPKQDSMRLRQNTGEFAHHDCVLAAADGQVPGAGDLFNPGTQTKNPVMADRDPINDFFEGGL
jgi:hypothetical protein